MYAEHAPAPRLRPYVRCYWTLRADMRPSSRVLPDGCIDVIFDRRRPAARFVGTMTRPLLIDAGGPVDVVGVRFEPGGAAPFLRLPAQSITDDAVDVRETWRAGIDVADRIAEREPLPELDAALLARLGDGEIDAAVVVCVRHIEAARGDMKISDLTRIAGCSERQLGRRFTSHVGVGPKRFARVVRFRAVLDAAPHVPRGGWADVAASLGFADQSHLLREVRTIGGASLRTLRPR
ncbi:MAG: helix-turn-helix domain-containing protein [Deltaproteobacteria bacterium]